MQYLLSLWAWMTSLDGAAALLAGWYLLRLRRLAGDEAARLLTLYFAMACFGAAAEAGIARLSLGWPQPYLAIARSIGRGIEMLTWVMLTLKLLGFLNGRAGRIAARIARGGQRVLAPVERAVQWASQRASARGKGKRAR